MFKVGDKFKVVKAKELNRMFGDAGYLGTDSFINGEIVSVTDNIMGRSLFGLSGKSLRYDLYALCDYFIPLSLAIRIYLAHPISNTYEAEASIATANRLRALGFEVYAAAENSAINDKTNDPTPMDIYNADIEQLEACDIVVVNITGGDQDGTIFEVGYACALGKKILGYTTNSRLRNPQIYKGIPSAKANHLVIGGVAVKGKWCGTFEGVTEVLACN